MIDTIALLLPSGSYKVVDSNEFKNVSRIHYGHAVRTSTHPTQQNDRKIAYFPLINEITRSIKGTKNKVLKIEFSATKLVFGNNFDELCNRDFQFVIRSLQTKLRFVGIEVSSENLANALVSKIHYSKNIILQDGTTPSQIIRYIEKTNYSNRADTNHRDYRNGGMTLLFHTNAYQVAIYDKIHELLSSRISEKRSIEKNSYIQWNLVDKVESARAHKKLEILRIEVRLNTRAKVKSTLKKLNYCIESTLENLFNEEIAKTILEWQVSNIEQSIPVSAYISSLTASDFLSTYSVNNPKSSISEILASYGVFIAQKELGGRELQNCLSKRHGRALLRFLKRTKPIGPAQNKGSPLQIIRESLQEFVPLKINQYIV